MLERRRDERGAPEREEGSAPPKVCFEKGGCPRRRWMLGDVYRKIPLSVI